MGRRAGTISIGYYIVITYARANREHRGDDQGALQNIMLSGALVNRSSRDRRQDVPKHTRTDLPEQRSISAVIRSDRACECICSGFVGLCDALHTSLLDGHPGTEGILALYKAHAEGP